MLLRIVLELCTYVHISVPISWKLLRLHHYVLPPTLQQTKMFTFMNVAYFEDGRGGCGVRNCLFSALLGTPSPKPSKDFYEQKMGSLIIGVMWPHELEKALQKATLSFSRGCE